MIPAQTGQNSGVFENIRQFTTGLKIFVTSVLQPSKRPTVLLGLRPGGRDGVGTRKRGSIRADQLTLARSREVEQLRTLRSPECSPLTVYSSNKLPMA